MIYNTAYIQSAPNTIDDILSYEENFSWDDNSNISHVLYFNISDILHTYGFVGEYIDIGGKNGDDDESFTVDTEKLKEALNYYNTLSKSFRITLDDEFQDIPEEFMNGKIICSIIDMSEFSKIRQMINLEGISYNICELPKINSELKMKGLSYTEVMVVNYMSDKVDMAKELAEYATYYRTDLIYPNTGMLPAKYSDYVDSFNETIQKQYSNSVVLPKFRVTKDYYLQMQSLLNAAWKGNNIDEMIQNITETYKKRLQ
jgi:maltose-binding protein MalE